MKTGIHPEYHTKAKITCACGNIITAGSTKKSIEVEICGACHPFYTGKEKLVDAAGRIEKFRAKVEKAKTKKISKKPLRRVHEKHERETPRKTRKTKS